MKTFTVLIIDDNVEFCTLLRTLAKHTAFTSKMPAGYNVVLTTHSDMTKLNDVVEASRTVKPGLVLLDYVLGVRYEDCLSSLSLLGKIIPYCRDIRMITGVNPGDVRLSLISGAFGTMGIDIVQKPLEVQELVEIVIDSILKMEKKEGK